MLNIEAKLATNVPQKARKDLDLLAELHTMNSSARAMELLDTSTLDVTGWDSVAVTRPSVRVISYSGTTKLSALISSTTPRWVPLDH